MIGRIWKFRDPLEFNAFLQTYTGLAILPVKGYKIAIAFGTTLSGKLPYDPGIREIIDKTLEGMAEFYLKEKVMDKPGYFRRFQL